jgi:hypothetical protein
MNEQLVRDREAFLMPLKTKSILTPSELKLLTRLQNWLVEKHGSAYQVICKTTLPAIADARLQDDRTSDAFWTSILDFCIFVNKVHGNARIVLVWSDNPNRVVIETILDEYSVPVIPIQREHGEDFSSLVSDVEIALRQRQSKDVSKMPKTVGNSWEKWLHQTASIAFYGTFADQQKMRDVLEGAEWINRRLFIEPCLAEFIEIPKDSGDEVFIFGYTSRADILITGSDSSLTPLLQLEVDGPCHDTPKGQRNDQKKEELLKQAGIPLLRVRIEGSFNLEATKGNSKAHSNSIGTEELQELFEGIFSDLCKFIAINSSFDKTDLSRIWEPFELASSELLRQKADEVRRINNTETLQADDIDSIFASIYEETEDLRWEANCEIKHFQEMAVEFLESDWEVFDDLLGTTKSTLTVDATNSITQSEYQAIFEGPGEKLTITVPAILLKYFAPDSALSADCGAFSLLPNVSFSELVGQLAMRSVRRLIMQQHSKSPFEQYISQGELDEYRRYWSRPQSQLEKSFVLACEKLLSRQRKAEIEASLSELTPERRAELEAIRNFDVNSIPGPDSPCKPKSRESVALPEVLELPTLHEYAKKFDRSPYACRHYPGVIERFVGKKKDIGKRNESKKAFMRLLRHEEIALAIQLKEKGMKPRHLNPA